MCGIEAHTHTDACYDIRQTCELEENEYHTHDRSCYEYRLTCTQPEHTHDAGCYGYSYVCQSEETTEQTAEEEPTEAHVHTEACYGDVYSCGLTTHIHTDACMEQELICDLPENELHTHNSYCYRFTPICGHTAHVHTPACFAPKASCGKTEHEHTDECYGRELTCGLEESSKHAHNKSCYLTCDRAEHEHTSECYPDLAPRCGLEEAAHVHTEQCYAQGLICGYDLPGNPTESGDEPILIEDASIFDEQESGGKISLDSSTETITKPTEELTEDETTQDQPAQQNGELIGDPEIGPMTTDLAYLDALHMGNIGDNGKEDVTENGQYKYDGITDGTAPWDEADVDGDDKNADNRRVRTFDTVAYQFNFGSHINKEGEQNLHTSTRVGFEFLLPATSNQAFFEIGEMPWLTAPAFDAKYKTEDVTIGGKNYQCLHGSFLWDADKSAITAATTSKSVVVRVLNMDNGAQLNVAISLWLQPSDVGVTWKDDVPVGTVYQTGYKCKTHNRQEFQTINPKTVTVTCTPRYNVTMRGTETASTSYATAANFDDGNGKALDKIISGSNVGWRYGRIYCYGLNVSIKGKDAAHGLRGCAIPKKGDTLDFDLEMETDYRTQGMTSLKTISQSSEYPTLVWSVEETRNGAQSDGRLIVGNAVPKYSGPWNKGGNSSAWYGDACYNGGNWTYSMENNGESYSCKANQTLGDLEGEYYIQTWDESQGSYVIGFDDTASGTQAFLKKNTGSSLQRFRFVPTSDGYYNIVNASTGKYLGLLNRDNQGWGSYFGMIDSDPTDDNVKWTINRKNGYARFEHKLSSHGMNLATVGVNLSQDMKIQTYDADPNYFGTNSGNSWKLIPAVDTDSDIYDGRYVNLIPYSSYDSGKVMQMDNISSASRVYPRDCEGTSNEIFRIVKLSSTTNPYALYAEAANCNLDIGGNATSDDSVVQMYSVNTSDAQTWDFVPVSGKTKDGSQVYQIISKTGSTVRYLKCTDQLRITTNGSDESTYWILSEPKNINRRVMHLSVSDYEFNYYRIPYRDNTSQTTATTYYDPKTIGDQFYNVQEAVISTTELWTLTPFYKGNQTQSNTQSQNYICKDKNDGAVTLISRYEVHNTKLNQIPIQIANKAVFYQESITLKASGYFESIISLLTPLGEWNSPLTPGCKESLNDFTTAGSFVTIQAQISSDGATDDDRLAAANSFIKFDDAFFEPYNQDEMALATGLSKRYSDTTHWSSVAWYVFPADYNRVPGKQEAKQKGYSTDMFANFDQNDTSVKTIFAAKKDGTGWDHHGKNPDQNSYDSNGILTSDSYDYEMMATKPEDLLWYDSLDDLKKDGKVCVGALTEYRGIFSDGSSQSNSISSMNHLHFSLHGRIKQDAPVNYAFAVTGESAGWRISDLRGTVGKQYGVAANEVDFWQTLDYSHRYFPTFSPKKQKDGTHLKASSDTLPKAGFSRSFAWDNTGRSDGRTGENGDNNFGRIRKPQITDSSVDGGQGVKYNIDCAYVVAYTSEVSIQTAQTIKNGKPVESVNGSATDTVGTNVSTYSYNLGQTAVDFRVQCRQIRSAGKGQDKLKNPLITTVYSKVTLPKGLTYIPGTSTYGGTYIQNTDYSINGKSDGRALEPTVTKNADGTTTLQWTIPDVSLAETSEYQLPIYFSTTVEEPQTGNTSYELVAECWNEYTKNVERKSEYSNLSKTSITVIKEEGQTINNMAAQRVVDVSAPLTFDLSIINDTNNTINNAKIADIIPFKEIGANSNFHGTMVVQSFEITGVENVDLSGVKLYYTKDTKYRWGNEYSANVKNADFTDSKIWTELSSSSGTFTRDGSKQKWINANKVQDITAIGFACNLPPKSRIYMKITFASSDAQPGDIVFNRLNLYNGSETRYKEANSQYVTRALEGYVWKDDNQDGLQADVDTEPPISGVKVSLYKLNESTNVYEPMCYQTLKETAFYLESNINYANGNDDHGNTGVKSVLVVGAGKDGKLTLQEKKEGNLYQLFRKDTLPSGNTALYNYGLGQYVSSNAVLQGSHTDTTLRYFANDDLSQWEVKVRKIQKFDGSESRDSEQYILQHSYQKTSDNSNGKVCLTSKNWTYQAGMDLLAYAYWDSDQSNTNFYLTAKETTLPMTVETGETTSYLATSKETRVTANTQGGGYYKFTDLPEGTYKVVFSDGSQQIRLLRATITDAENNSHDTIDSDGTELLNNDGLLGATFIEGIVLPNSKQIDRANYVTSNHDQGLYPAGREMPATGGSGTTVFYLVGAGLMLLVILVAVLKRKKQYQ